MLRLSALAVGLVFLASVAVAGSPSLASTPTTPAVQKFVDSLLKIAEVQQAFQEGDTVEVKSGSGSWHGTVRSGEVTLEAGDISATHTLTVDPNAMMSIINAYNMPNTAKLAVKKQYMVANSERASVMTAIGAVARTPLDERLPTTTPKAGDSIKFEGCTGTLAAYDQGRFVVTLCDDRYTVNEIGGISSKLAREHLTSAPAQAGSEPDEANSESYGADGDRYTSCEAKIGPHPVKSNYEGKRKWRTAAKKWHKLMNECLAGA